MWGEQGRKYISNWGQVLETNTGRSNLPNCSIHETKTNPIYHHISSQKSKRVDKEETPFKKEMKQTKKNISIPNIVSAIVRYLHILALNILIFLKSKWSSHLPSVFSSIQQQATKALDKATDQQSSSSKGSIYQLHLSSNPNQKLLYINHYETVMMIWRQDLMITVFLFKFLCEYDDKEFGGAE